MVIVKWSPSRQSEKSALERFPGDWQIHETMSKALPVKGEHCLFIHPVGHPLGHSRWVAISRITFPTGCLAAIGWDLKS